MKTVFLLLMVLFYSQIYSQPDNCSLLGRWANGSTMCVESKNNIAYIGNGSYLTLVDVSTPETPTAISNLLMPNMVQGVTLNGDFAYVSAGQKGLIIVDVSNVNNPVQVGALETFNLSTKPFYSNNKIYLMYNGGVLIIDVSTPSAPTQVGSISNSEIQDIYVEGDYAYTPSKSSGTFIYNISDPASPTYVSTIGAGNYAKTVIANGNLAYIGAGGNLYTYNIEDKTDVKELSSIACVASYLALENDTIFATGTWNDLTIVDVSNSASPKITGTLPYKFFSDAKGITVSGSNILIADSQHGLRIIDATNHSALTQTGIYTTAGPYFYNVTVKGDIAYLIDFANGLFILDVKDKANINRIAVLNPTDEKFFKGLSVVGNYAYMGSQSGLYIIDVSDPKNPSITKKFGTTRISDVKVVGNYAYITYWQSRTFSIVDISDPENPVEKSTLAGPAAAIDVKDNFAYVIGQSESGFYTINIADPVNPVIESFTGNKNISFARYIFARGNYVYTSGHGLNITDITDPKNPEVVGTLGGNFWSSITVINGDAYVGYNDGLLTINVSDPENPKIIGKYKTPNTYVSELFASETTIYLTQAYNGLYVLNNDTPTAVENDIREAETELFQNYPNPFSNNTTIEYRLPARAHVTLKIYDVTGREIETLENGDKEAGKHSVQWKRSNTNGQELFYRLSVDNNIVLTKKMTNR